LPAREMEAEPGGVLTQILLRGMWPRRIVHAGLAGPDNADVDTAGARPAQRALYCATLPP
jgi:hypothetical protein